LSLERLDARGFGYPLAFGVPRCSIGRARESWMRLMLGPRQSRAERFERRLALARAGAPEPVPERAEAVAIPARLLPLTAAHARTEGAFPDLLNPTPCVSVDQAALRAALAFSFVAEDEGGAIAAALDAAPLAASSFDPECFFRELFVAPLVRQCMRARVDGEPARVHEGYVLRVLSQPPSELAVTLHRQQVWRALLADAEARAALGALHRALAALFRLFRGEGQLGIRGEQARRRLDILKQLHALFERLAAPAFARSDSALARLPAFAARVRNSDGHARLCDLLHYESERAFADLTVQLAADGSIRALRLHALREDKQSRYHTPLIVRWLGRAWLWLSGYRVGEAEVLDRWLDQVFEGVAEFLPALVQLSGDLDVLLSGLAFHDACAARGMAVCFPEFAAGDEGPRFESLFNPLLFALDVTPVPCALALDQHPCTTLITGPNSGGKTRLLQALGIAQLCAQAGMVVPAAQARLRAVPGIFASLTQETSADQPEGRLGTELLRIRMLFERAQLGSLLLVDELCSGTSPSEGEELFRMVLELLAELGPSAFVSTHFLAFAAELARRPAGLTLHFVQVQLDAEERPTYRFVPGVAATSLARRTAQRLGVTREELKGLVAQKGDAHGVRKI
jgi:DNA mismatch repair protein MutS2